MPQELAHKDFYTFISTLITMLFLAISIQSSIFIKGSGYSSYEGIYKFAHSFSVGLVLLGLAVSGYQIATAFYRANDSHVSMILITLMIITATLFVITDFILGIFKKNNLVGVFYLFIVCSLIIIAAEIEFI